MNTQFYVGHTDFKALDNVTSIVKYAAELEQYRANRSRPKNKLYYALKLAEEAGELGEVAIAIDGNRRKIKKLGGVANLRTVLLEELGDCYNQVMLFAEQNNVSVSQVIDAAARKLHAKRNSGSTHG